MGLGISKRFSKSHPLPRGSCKSRIEHPLGGSRSVRRNKGSSQGDLGLYVRFNTFGVVEVIPPIHEVTTNKVLGGIVKFAHLARGIIC